jgi:hypothetical protein
VDRSTGSKHFFADILDEDELRKLQGDSEAESCQRATSQLATYA